MTLPSRPGVSDVLTIFYYRDVDAAADWYRRIFGPAIDLGAAGVHMFRLTPTSCLALVSEAQGSQRPIDGPNKGAILSVGTHDIAAWHAHLIALGDIEVPRTLSEGCGGLAFEFKLRDPEGYTLEFLEWKAPLPAQD